MSPLDSFAAAGYAVVPARNCRLIVGGAFAGRYHYTPGERFADFDVGLVCAGLPIPGATGRGNSQVVTPSRATGAGTLSAIASTWIAAIRWTTHNPAIRKEIDTLVSAALGDGPAYVDGDTVTRLARVDQLFGTRQLPPLHFSGEDWKSLKYQPHRFEVMCRGAFLVLNRNSKPTPRAELPIIDGEGAERLIFSVETAFTKRGALPWR